MINLYFIEYRFDEATGEFQQIGVWMHNPEDGDVVDLYYPDESCPEAEEAMWVINRIVEGEMKTPSDFLEFHQARADFRGMRGPVKETDTAQTYGDFALLAIKMTTAEALHDTTF